MKFFLPFAKNAEQAEQVYSTFTANLKILGSKLDEKRIYSLEYVHNSIEEVAMVGGTSTFTGETVIAIISARESKLFYVFTPNRGLDPKDPGPFLVGENEIRDIKYFD